MSDNVFSVVHYCRHMIFIFLLIFMHFLMRINHNNNNCGIVQSLVSMVLEDCSHEDSADLLQEVSTRWMPFLLPNHQNKRNGRITIASAAKVTSGTSGHRSSRLTAAFDQQGVTSY